MAAIDAVIFDYYETLAALPREPREHAFDELAQRVGVDLPPAEPYRHWRELTPDWSLPHQRPPLDGVAPPFRPFHDVWCQRSDELFRRWGVDMPGEVGAEAYAEAHAAAPLYHEVPEALDALRGRFQLAVLSDADEGFLRESLRRNGLAFEVVILSEEVRAYKPHVSMFREVCTRLGVEPAQAVYVGDSPWADIAGARHAGLRAVWLDRHGASWPEDIEPPEIVITDLSELGGAL